MDEDGFVQCSAMGNVASLANVSLEEAKNAIKTLESPDAESGNPDHEGRRIERVPGGWIVLNATTHREIITRDMQKERTRLRVRKHRAAKECNGDVTVRNDSVTPSEAVSVSVSESKKEKEEELSLSNVSHSEESHSEKSNPDKTQPTNPLPVHQVASQPKDDPNHWDWYSDAAGSKPAAFPAASGPRDAWLTGPSDEIKALWDAYPKKVQFGKLKDTLPGAIATLVVERGVTDAEAFAWLLGVVREYAASPAGQQSQSARDGRPSPSLWLSDERWRDDRSAWKIRNGASDHLNGQTAKKPKVPPRPAQTIPNTGDVLMNQMISSGVMQ